MSALPPGPKMPRALQAIGWTQRPLPFLQRRFAHQAPALAETHHEVIAPIHHDHFIFRRQLFFQPPRRGHAAKPAAEN